MIAGGYSLWLHVLYVSLVVVFALHATYLKWHDQLTPWEVYIMIEHIYFAVRIAPPVAWLLGKVGADPAGMSVAILGVVVMCIMGLVRILR